jgi:DNA-binding XRE family transcriptional regulator
VSPVTIRLIETEKTDPKLSTLIKIRNALSKAGIEFLDGDSEHGDGVRFRKPRK